MGMVEMAIFQVFFLTSLKESSIFFNLQIFLYKLLYLFIIKTIQYVIINVNRIIITIHGFYPWIVIGVKGMTFN